MQCHQMCSVLQFLATLCHVQTLFNVELHYDITWLVLGKWLDGRGGTVFRILRSVDRAAWYAGLDGTSKPANQTAPYIE